MVGLTDWLRRKEVRAEWRKAARLGRRFIQNANKERRGAPLQVPPSAWTMEHRWGLTGTVFDYVLGVVWGRQEMSSFIERAYDGAGYSFSEHVSCAERIAREQVDSVRKRPQPKNYDFFRALGALAEFDAMSRSSAPAPQWALACRAPMGDEYRQVLVSRYPDSFVQEIIALLLLAKKRLPTYTDLTYNPSFEGKSLPGLGADGDLLLDGLLLDVKTIIKPAMSSEQLWQLLAYSALDARHGKARVTEVGIYSARFGLMWCNTLEAVSLGLGFEGFGSFCSWFKDLLRAHPPR